MMLEDGIIQSSSGSGVASDGDLKEAKRLYTLAVGDRDYSLPPQQQQQQQRPHYHHDLHQDQSNLFIPLAMYCEGAFRLGRMIELEQTSCVLLDKKEVGVGMEEKGNEKVLRLYSLAVDKGRHPDAAFRLAQLYQQNHQLVSSKTANIANTSSSSSPLPDFDPYQLYLLAAEQGHCEAQFCLGEMFEYGNRYDGTGGNSNNNIKINTASLFDVDLEKAIRYYKQASNQGHAESQYRLGFMYHLNGRCIIEHNIETAIHYYKLAALQGHVESQYQLGRIFEQQQFVTGISTTNTDSTTDSPTSSSSSTDNDQHRRRYLDQAIDFYKLASMQGHGEAQLRLARIFKLGVKGIDVDKSKELALRYSRLAADNGISIFNADEMEDMLSEEEGMDIRCFSDAGKPKGGWVGGGAVTSYIEIHIHEFCFAFLL